MSPPINRSRCTKHNRNFLRREANKYVPEVLKRKSGIIIKEKCMNTIWTMLEQKLRKRDSRLQTKNSIIKDLKKK